MALVLDGNGSMTVGNGDITGLATGALEATAIGSGAILQSLNTTTSVSVNLTNGVWVNSGLSTNIVTKANNSKIAIIASVGFNLQSIPGNGISFRITRGGSAIWAQGQTRYSGLSSTGDNEGWVTLIYIDSPSSSSGTTLTYEIQAYAHASAGRVQDATDSSIILMEIAS